MNICVIGHEGRKQRSHFAENIVIEFRNKEHDVEFLTCEAFESQLSKKNWHRYRINRVRIPLSSFIFPKDYDFILIDQNDFAWTTKNVEVPIFYNFKYVHRKFDCYYPTVGLFMTQPIKMYCEKVFAAYECYKTPHKYVMLSATETDTYQPKEKIYKGITLFGSRNAHEEHVDDVELLAIAQKELYRYKEHKLREVLGDELNEFGTPMPTLKFRELLPHCEGQFLTIPRANFISRMLWENMACKVVSVFEIASDRHEKVLKECGLINGEHYIGIKNISEVKEAWDNADKKKIAEQAYELVLNRHLYKHRAEQILQIYSDLFG